MYDGCLDTGWDDELYGDQADLDKTILMQLCALEAHRMALSQLLETREQAIKRAIAKVLNSAQAGLQVENPSGMATIDVHARIQEILTNTQPHMSGLRRAVSELDQVRLQLEEQYRKQNLIIELPEYSLN